MRGVVMSCEILSNEQLVELYQANRDEDAFSELYQRLGPPLEAFIGHLLRSLSPQLHGDTADILQTVLPSSTPLVSVSSGAPG